MVKRKASIMKDAFAIKSHYNTNNLNGTVGLLNIKGIKSTAELRSSI